MKASLFVKFFLVLPLILFMDYLLMAVIGCTTCLFGLGEDFYCGPFCFTGKVVLGISLIFFGYLLYPDLKTMSTSKKHSPVAKADECMQTKMVFCDLYETSVKKN